MCHTQLRWRKGYTCMRLSPGKHNIIRRNKSTSSENFLIIKYWINRRISIDSNVYELFMLIFWILNSKKMSVNDKCLFDHRWLVNLLDKYDSINNYILILFFQGKKKRKKTRNPFPVCQIAWQIENVTSRISYMSTIYCRRSKIISN
jgi:hypothetical protein